MKLDGYSLVDTTASSYYQHEAWFELCDLKKWEPGGDVHGKKIINSYGRVREVWENGKYTDLHNGEHITPKPHPPQQEESRAGSVVGYEPDNPNGPLSRSYEHIQIKPLLDEIKPKVEESRGEGEGQQVNPNKISECCNAPVRSQYFGVYEGYCSKCLQACNYTEKAPQLKEESPKEDEDKEFDKRFVGIKSGFGDWLTEESGSLIKDYIKANFVSKVKIDRLLTAAIQNENLPIELIIIQLRYSLGLEEL